MMSSSSSSSSSSSRWSRLALFAAVPTVVAAATAYLYSQYQTEQKELAERKRAPKGKKGKKGTNSTAAPSSSSSPLDSGILLSPAQAAALAALDDSIPAEFATEQEFVLALHQDVELRARDRANPKLERRIWYAIRKIDPTPSSISSMSHTARTEIGQWIVAYHANATPLLDGTENPSIKPTAGGPAGTSHTKYLRVALDYDLAWALLESVETELSKIEKRTDEQEELRKSTELVLLDLAHKMRNAERMLSLYKRIRGRNTNVDADTGRLDPQQFTEMEFFTLWMLSPLLGQWYDFKDWSDFMDSKGQSLDEFHHLATQRPDLIDFRQMYRMVNQAAEQGRVIGWDTEKKTKEEEETKAKDESAKTEEKPKESTEVSESSTEKNESESTTETATEAEKESSNTETKTETETETSSESTDKPTDSESSTAADTTSTSSSSATPAAAAAAAPPTGPVIIPPSCTSSTIPSPSLLWDHPDSSELRWSNWDIVGTVWKFIASSGDDEDAIKQYVDSHRPENEWKSIAVGAVGFKKIGACARIQSMISSAVPICGPLLVAKDGTNATAADESSSTADHADGASSSESTNSSSSSSSGSFTPFVFHGTGSVHFRAEIPAKTKGAPPQRRLLKLCEEYRDFKLLKDEEAKELLKKYRVKKNKKTTDDEKEKSTTADDASSTEPSEATATAESTAAASEAAVAVAAEDEFDNSDLTVEEYDPSNPPQLWRGVYIFEQYSVEEALVQHPVTGRILGTRHLPAAKPFMHVEHELIIKMTETVRAQ